MNDARNALTVDAVVERFALAEQLLSDAAERIQSLGDATESATESSTALTQAARGLATASNQLVVMATEIARSSELDQPPSPVHRGLRRGPSRAATDRRSLSTRPDKAASAGWSRSRPKARLTARP